MKLLFTIIVALGLMACQTTNRPEGAPDVPMLVVEYGADWCHWCNVARPELIELTKKFNGEFFLVDADKVPTTPSVFVYTGIPMVAIFNHDQIFYFGPYDQKAMTWMLQELRYALDLQKK